MSDPYPSFDDPRVTKALRDAGSKNNSRSIKKLLRAIAASGTAKANQHDVILLGAVEVIEALEKAVITADYTGTSGDRS